MRESNKLGVAIIGVIGTLLGTVLGWFLNVLSNKGKITVYLSSWTDAFRHNDNEGLITISTTESQAEYYEFECSLDIYNSSSDTKILRDIKIVFRKGKNKLFGIDPDDKKTKRSASGRTIYDRITAQNIPPKSVVRVDMVSGLWIKEAQLERVFSTDSVYLEYFDEKNKLHRTMIKSINYQNYFNDLEGQYGQDEDAE